MSSGRQIGAVVCALTVAAGVSGCGKDEAKLPPAGNESPSAADSSATATAAPTAIPTSYPDIGLEFSSLPTVKGAQTEALRTYVAFERGQSKMTLNGKMNGLLTKNGAGHALDAMRQTVSYLQKNDGRYAGTVVLSVTVVGANENSVSLAVCEDDSKLTMTEHGKPSPLEGPKRSAADVVATSGGGLWKITEYNRTGKAC